MYIGFDRFNSSMGSIHDILANHGRGVFPFIKPLYNIEKANKDGPRLLTVNRSMLEQVLCRLVYAGADRDFNCWALDSGGESPCFIYFNQDGIYRWYRRV